MAKLTPEETKERIFKLRLMQSVPLSVKVKMSLWRIERALRQHRNPYVAFSGGKDSMVLSILVQQVDPDIPHVFHNTGLEQRGTLGRVAVWRCASLLTTKPVRSVADMLRNEGYPFFGKLQAEMMRQRQQGGRSTYVERNWPRLVKYLNAGVALTERCCDYLKKKPAQALEAANGFDVVFLGIRADESDRRKFRWVDSGCSSPGKGSRKLASESPLSFWTEQDVQGFLAAEGIDWDIDRTGCVVCGFCPAKGPQNNFVQLWNDDPRRWRRVMFDWGYYEACTKLGYDTGGPDDADLLGRWNEAWLARKAEVGWPSLMA